MGSHKKQGFIGLIIVIIVAIVLLKLWFDFDAIAWLKQPEVKGVFSDIWEVVLYVWEKFLKGPAMLVFRVIHDLITKNL